jgi:hypothetical protein
MRYALIAGAIGAVSLMIVLLHYFCLWLERRGLLFYMHRKPSSSAASSFVAMQQVIEPSTRQIATVDEHLDVTQVDDLEDTPGPQRRARRELSEGK